jgi:hypothetical protein
MYTALKYGAVLTYFGSISLEIDRNKAVIRGHIALLPKEAS